MKYLIVVLAFFLSGCLTNPSIKHKFPEPPVKLLEKCPQLKKLAEDEERLSELLKVVSENYGTYYDCAVKNDALIEWIQKQTIIHDDVFNKD
jgi:hypothetical protein